MQTNRIARYVTRSATAKPKKSAAETVRTALSVLSSTEAVDGRVLTIADKLMERDLTHCPGMSAEEASKRLREWLAVASEIVAGWRDDDRLASVAG
jgi:broad specificity phosphatase PhoE